jgi:hypothetical protein
MGDDTVTELTIDEIAERLSTRPSFYLHCAAVDRRFDDRPKDIPTLAVVRGRAFDYTATHDREGESVPPPGRGWSEFGRLGGSTFYRRPYAVDYFADAANVRIRSRYDDEREILVLDAVVREMPERIRKLIDDVSCDSKHGWVITIDLAVVDAEVATGVGESFAAEMTRIIGGHGGVLVRAGDEPLHHVEAYWN